MEARYRYIEIINEDECGLIVCIRNKSIKSLTINGSSLPTSSVFMAKIEYGEVVLIRKADGSNIDPDSDVEISQAEEDLDSLINNSSSKH